MTNIHPLQHPFWGEFREKTGVEVVRENDLQLTIHSIPYTNYKIGYFPKGGDITQKMLDDLYKIGKNNNCIFIQIEPNVEKVGERKYNFKNFYPSAHPIFTKYNFVLDLTKSEEELLKNMSQKTRYNIRLAQKKGVEVIEDNSDKGFEQYLKLTRETTQRQKFFAHNEKYHKTLWETFKNKNHKEFSIHLLKAVYKNQTLATWVLFVLGDTLYYPYGASSDKYREVMASNLVMWEAIKFGKKLGLKTFDMWGAANVVDPKPDNIYYGFHRFKQGYGPRHVEYIGSFDLVINKNLYFAYKVLDKIRWFVLRFK
ncbi:MAG: peptidoglycan bridge formation glycyltransferase FemA/FemB family protein [Candidatus Levybacteria bacterium]|nr:peptidoglycan bridge formation glycyltransferase FemA/FemB family protein [Candidatus Levybacteria bacterium]